MENNHHHQPNIKRSIGNREQDKSIPSVFQLAMSATFHCLVGCGIGEISGMIIATAFGWNNFQSALLSVFLGFTGGVAFGMIPLLRNGFQFFNALKTVILGEGLSIVVMLIFELIMEFSIPGVMDAHLTDSIFWIGMVAALGAGFIAAFPVNYYMIKRGIIHNH